MDNYYEQIDYKFLGDISVSGRGAFFFLVAWIFFDVFLDFWGLWWVGEPEDRSVRPFDGFVLRVVEVAATISQSTTLFPPLKIDISSQGVKSNKPHSPTSNSTNFNDYLMVI